MTYRNKCFLFVIAASLIIQFGFLTHRGFWANELITLNCIKFSFKEIFYERLQNNHSPVYFLFLKFWAGIFGYSEASLRFPSAIFGVLIVLYVFKLVSHYAGEQWGVIGALAALFNQNILYAAHDIRMYIILQWAAVASAYYFLLLFEQPKFSIAIKYFAVSLIGAAVQLLFIPVTAAQLVFIIFHNKEIKGRITPLVSLLISPIIAISPIFYLWANYQRNIKEKLDLKEFNIIGFFRSLIKTFWGDSEDFKIKILIGIGVLLFIVIVYLLVKRYKTLEREKYQDLNKKKEFYLLQYLLLWYCIVCGFILLSSVFTENILGRMRYYSAAIGAAPVLFVLAAKGITNDRVKKTIVFSGLFLIFCFGGGYLFSRGDGVRETIAYIEKNKSPDDCFIYCHKGSVRHGFGYYGLTGMDSVGISRSEKDEKKIMDIVMATCKDKKRLWVFLYHEKKTPLLRIVEKNTQLFKKIGDTQTFGDVKLGLFEIAILK